MLILKKVIGKETQVEMREVLGVLYLGGEFSEQLEDGELREQKSGEVLETEHYVRVN